MLNRNHTVGELDGNSHDFPSQQLVSIMDLATSTSLEGDGLTHSEWEISERHLIHGMYILRKLRKAVGNRIAEAPSITQKRDRTLEQISKAAVQSYHQKNNSETWHIWKRLQTHELN